MIAKTRPALVLYYPKRQDVRALVTLAPLTSEIKGGDWEILIEKPFWLPKISAIDVQGLISHDKNALSRKMGVLAEADLQRVRMKLKEFLQL